MPTVYEIVTQTIIEKQEAGEVPWAASVGHKRVKESRIRSGIQRH